MPELQQFLVSESDSVRALVCPGPGHGRAGSRATSTSASTSSPTAAGIPRP